MRAPITLPRALLEDFIQAAIDLLDAADAGADSREPDDEDEVVSEDDGVVVGMSAHVGRQWS